MLGWKAPTALDDSASPSGCACARGSRRGTRSAYAGDGGRAPDPVVNCRGLWGAKGHAPFAAIALTINPVASLRS
jgi:hypothetical protein